MKKTLLPLIVLVTAFVMASPAIAEIKGGELTISPFVGGYTFDGIQHLDTSISGGLAVGYNLTKNWGVEGRFAYTPLTSTIVKTEGNQYSVWGDVLYHFMPESRFVPFLALGGGWTRTTDLFGPENDDATLAYGGGVKYFINDWIALRGDVRHLLTFHTSNFGATDNWSNFEYNVGLTFQFPLKKDATPTKVAVAPAVREEKPREAKPAPTPAASTPAGESSEVILPGRLPSPSSPTPAPITESPSVPSFPVSEGPTSWQAEKTVVPEGKILITGLKIEQNALEIVATERIKDFTIFTLTEPSRLIIDIDRGLNGFRAKSITIKKIGISTVNFVDYSDHVRLTIDPTQGRMLPYRAEETDQGLKVIVTSP